MAKVHPAISEYYRKLGKKSAVARRKMILAKAGKTQKNIDDLPPHISPLHVTKVEKK